MLTLLLLLLLWGLWLSEFEAEGLDVLVDRCFLRGKSLLTSVAGVHGFWYYQG